MIETKKAAPVEQQPNTDNRIIPQFDTARPSISETNAKKIPLELRERNQWVLWRLEQRNGDGKPTKIPYSINRKHADSTDQQTWTSFEQAWRTYINANGHFNGIGYVFSADDPFTGVDLDNCIREGKINDEARAIVKELNSYTERSQSKTGLHIIIHGKVPGDRRRTGNYEMYDSARFFCITGDHILGTPETIEERQRQLDTIYNQIFDKRKPEKKSNNSDSTYSSMGDEEIISTAVRARNGSKFSALYAGDHSDYGSQSEADLALCNLLAFYTKDPEQIDRMFRASGLMRDKWDRDDYSTRTIESALNAVTEQYNRFRNDPVVSTPHGYHKPDLKLLEGREKPIFSRTDLGNAKRLVYRHGHDIRYCYPFSNWFIWDGKRWEPDNTGEIERRAKETVLNIYKEATDAPDDQRIALSKHAIASEARNKIMAMIASAQSEPEIPVKPEQLDGDFWKLNCLNGTIDLKTGELLPHHREDYNTKLATVEYDSNADCPTWKTFLNRIMQDEDGKDRPDLVQFLQKAIGYSLTGSISEQCMFFLYGGGKNGKSTFINVIRDLLGEYAEQSNTETFMMKQSSGNGASSDVARLKGSRLVAATESDEGKRLAESLIKQLTGGDSITARFLYKESFEFKPTFKIFFVSNHKPQIKGIDRGIWRRIRLIPFTTTIRDDEDDKSLPDKLKSEMPGILRWAVEGCLMWQQEGLGMPQAVAEATDEYREEMDTLAHFIEENCVINPDARVVTKKLYECYREWCEENGEYTLAKNKFINRMKERIQSIGYYMKEYKSGSIRGWTGIGLASETTLPDMSKPRQSTIMKEPDTKEKAETQPAVWEVGEL